MGWFNHQLVADILPAGWLVTPFLVVNSNGFYPPQSARKKFQVQEI